MGMGPTDLEYDEAVFYTHGDWSCLEASSFLQGIEDLYGVFVALWLAKTRLEQAGVGKYGKSLSDYVLTHRIEGDDPSGPWSQSLSPQPVRSSLGDLPFGPEARYLRFLFDHRHRFAEGMRPRIAYWHMASPGEIRISGAAAMIRQIREFVKDLSYRNRQERQLGDLEIARKHVELTNSMLTPPATDYMSSVAIEKYEPLRLLEDNHKLLPPQDHRTQVEALLGVVLHTEKLYDSPSIASEKIFRLRWARDKREITQAIPAIEKAIEETAADRKWGSSAVSAVRKAMDDLKNAVSRVG
jgi:hypothetical protein